MLITQRQLVRLLFLIPLALSLAAWIYSVNHVLNLGYCHNGYLFACVTHSGEFEVGWNKRVLSDDGFITENHKTPFHLLHSYDPGYGNRRTFLGFAYYQNLSLTVFSIPLYLPILLSILALTLLRMQRRKGLASAFPIQSIP